MGPARLGCRLPACACGAAGTHSAHAASAAVATARVMPEEASKPRWRWRRRRCVQCLSAKLWLPACVLPLLLAAGGSEPSAACHHRVADPASGRWVGAGGWSGESTGEAGGGSLWRPWGGCLPLPLPPGPPTSAAHACTAGTTLCCRPAAPTRFFERPRVQDLPQHAGLWVAGGERGKAWWRTTPRGCKGRGRGAWAATPS